MLLNVEPFSAFVIEMGKDIIVVGASAGGIEGLQKLAASLPADLPASVFVVLHVLPSMPSQLPAILSRSGPLPAVHADSQPIEPGRIYVAPPDHHVLIEHGRVHLWRGPKENRHRPAINPLFRSAAVSYGSRVVGVILSGCLDDGSAGLWWIKRYGGLAIVQDPAEAAFPEMILNALEYVDIDYTPRRGPNRSAAGRAGRAQRGRRRYKIPSATGCGEVPTMEEKKALELTCPDCRGPLSEIRRGDLREYRCLVGHSYSARSILEAHSEVQEKALWAAVVALEEANNLVRKVAPQLPPELAERLQAQAAAKLRQAADIRRILEQLEPFQVE